MGVQYSSCFVLDTCLNFLHLHDTFLPHNSLQEALRMQPLHLVLVELQEGFVICRYVPGLNGGIIFPQARHLYMEMNILL